MAQYWYKPEKRVKRISEQDDRRDVIEQVKALKAKGYVKVSDRRNPQDTIIEQVDTPSLSWTSKEIKAWLDSNDIKYTGSQDTKSKLLALIK